MTLRRAELLGDRTGTLDGLWFAGDHELSGRVVVGDPDVALGALAGRLRVVVGGPEHGGHRAWSLLGRVVHGLATFDHEAHAVLEPERARSGEGGVLAEAVPGAERGLHAYALDGVQHHEAEHEARQLGVAGQGELVLLRLEQ